MSNVRVRAQKIMVFVYSNRSENEAVREYMAKLESLVSTIVENLYCSLPVNRAYDLPAALLSFLCRRRACKQANHDETRTSITMPQLMSPTSPVRLPRSEARNFVMRELRPILRDFCAKACMERPDDPEESLIAHLEMHPVFLRANFNLERIQLGSRGSFEPFNRATFDSFSTLVDATDIQIPSINPCTMRKPNMDSFRRKVERLSLPVWWLPTARWQLVWWDDFDYVGLPDPQRWSFQVSCNRWVHDEHHNELQWYTSNRRENAWVENGCLRVTAMHEKWENMDYTSARLHSKGRGEWLFGRIEVCARLPPFRRGLWPGIWMLPAECMYGRWPNSGEIDLCETVGWQHGVVHASIHTAAYNHRDSSHLHATILKEGADQGFHVYCVIWRPDRIIICLDGDEVQSFQRQPSDSWREWPFDRNFFLLLNVAVGGNWAGRQGVDNSAFPASLEVAYVRVFEEREP